MLNIHALLSELDEKTIARKITLKHDEARRTFRLHSIKVPDYDAFSKILGDYYKHHFTNALCYGDSIVEWRATQTAREIVEEIYKKKGGNISNAIRDACDGSNGGISRILDLIAEHIKNKDVEAYINGRFSEHINTIDFDEHVEVIRQFIKYFKNYLPPDFDITCPERYAHNYKELIRAYLDGLKRTSATFNRT